MVASEDLKELKEFDELLKKISKNQYTDEVLELSEKGINDTQAKALATALKSNTHIKIVNLSNNKIENGGAEALATIPLDELDLSSNQIGATGAKALASAKVGLLSLSGNPLKAEGVQHFSGSKYIREILLSQCEAGNDGAKAVLKNNHFESVDLSNNNITNTGVEEISGASLVNLNLSQNQLTSKGTESIARLKSLRIVNLGSNQLGDAGVLPFVRNEGIESLDLTQNGITGKGFSDICKNTALKRVELYNNDIEFDADAPLPSSPSLVVVGLGRNKLDSRCVKVLQTLASIKNLEDLVLVGNKIDDTGAKILYQYKSKSLKQIDLTDNPILDESLIKKGFDLR